MATVESDLRVEASGEMEAQQLISQYVFIEDKAECLKPDSPREMFYVDTSTEMEKALGVCARCPVLFACAEMAVLAFEEYGVLGGMSERERRRIRKEILTPIREETGITRKEVTNRDMLMSVFRLPVEHPQRQRFRRVIERRAEKYLLKHGLKITKEQV